MVFNRDMKRRVMFLLPLAVLVGSAQGPVVFPRTVLNPFTLQPAPSRVTPGGLLVLRGINLGPVEEAKASGTPLPTRLADPPVQVMVNNRAAPLFSVGSGRIVLQVPWETPQGLATIVVRRGELASRATSVQVVNFLPAVRSRNDLGFGEAMGTLDGSTLKLTATGLGPTDPQPASGEAGPADPRVQIRAYVGGLPARTSAKLSEQRVGEYDVSIEIPADARPGDVISLEAGNNPPANRPTFGKATAAEVQFLRVPEGAASIRVLRAADLRGNYIVASAARGENGCYPSWLFDLGRGLSSRIEDCLIAAGVNAPSPVTPINESGSLAALVGPATGEVQTGLTSRVTLFNPASQVPMNVELPAPASTLAGQAGRVLAVAPTTPPTAFAIDPQTGDVTEALAPAGGGQGGQPGAAAININTLALDLGDGLTHLLSPLVNLGQQRFAIVVGDNAEKPAKAKLALLNNQGAVADTRDFPDGWLPLIPPLLANQGGGAPGGQPGQPGLPGQPGPGGLPGGGGAGALARFRLPMNWDPLTRNLFILSRNPDGSSHSVTVFGGPELQSRTVSLPDGWFAASCWQQIPLFNLELSRQLALLGAAVASTEASTACLSNGFLLLDIPTQRFRAIPLPGQGQINAAGAIGDINDYLFGASSDGGNRNLSDTLFVLDSVAGSAFRLGLPAGVTQFAGLQPVPELSALLAAATNRQPGDGGLVYFDLENEAARILPIPEGFVSINIVAVFEDQRKVVARGNKPNNSGSQYLIYDLQNGDLLMPDNPPGVVFVGQLPAQPAPGGQPGQPQPPAQYQVVNVKSGFVAAVGFGENRQPLGVLAIRVP
jgi:uncharacterized protein (TIGR03437 family)